jgi:hypothetical protein
MVASRFYGFTRVRIRATYIDVQQVAATIATRVVADEGVTGHLGA